ncbi:hypothetical protein [uncultured Desulfovibrio sp.]|uniref:hypothetical protein n=1 Tax=uncultured Desulfovibrio sp. TaxID=167968 RepID=UPI0026225FFB|nr:hypothetical protein [uncultured Desulfovibrio sp.]
MKEFGVTYWLNSHKAAAHISTTEAELARDRMREQPEIPFIRLKGQIRYSDRELDAFLNRLRGEGV